MPAYIPQAKAWGLGGKIDNLQGELTMTHLNLLTILIILCSLLSLSNSFAEDYTRWKLPDGAIARFGKGSIRELVYFPDGTRLAVKSSIGIWIYDAHTGKEVELLTRDELLAGDAWDVNPLAFSPDGRTLAVTSDKNIRLLDSHTRTQIGVPRGTHRGGVFSSLQSNWRNPREREQ